MGEVKSLPLVEIRLDVISGTAKFGGVMYGYVLIKQSTGLADLKVWGVKDGNVDKDVDVPQSVMWAVTKEMKRLLKFWSGKEAKAIIT